MGAVDQNPPGSGKKQTIISLQICTYNVRSLASRERLLELKESLKYIKYDIIGLAQVRRMGVNIIEDNDHILCYSGEIAGRNGVGFLVKKQYKGNITNFIGISGRVCVLQLQIGKIDLTLIQAYVPTARSNESEVEYFYSDLEKAHSLATKYIISMGDYKSMIGIPKSEDSLITGKYGYGARNTRGERLLQNENKLMIINTVYKKKQKHKWTWISPDRKTRNEIDYILSNSPHITSFELISNKLFPSDHKLLTGTIRLDTVRKNRKMYTDKCNQLITEESRKLYLSELIKLKSDLSKSAYIRTRTL